ncbi:hypothetical protein I0C86_22745 [Plantactinospora sp. S1510]|uniref:DUF2993 domain-containing protein n=1 Tax=Plantactinospora alkalitolerans TaxID=2789879 RepID=A0ABS0H010_9ACTN|nr:hypothetical protein [Plantactinospora alkalitolerans]MBF9131760.1 hypothetical protein [Plantactinospora alkalitolerans]
MTTDPPWLAPPGQPDPPATQRSRRWLVAGLVGWIVVLLAVTYVSVRRDEPTVREQRSIEQAGPVVDRTLGDLVAAAGPDVVVELAERRLRTGCEITLFRSGAAIDAAITVRAPEAEAPEVLDRIASRLPAAYQAGVRHRSDGAADALRADAGQFVAVEGELVEPGVVRLTVQTGCRPTSGESEERTTSSPPPPTEEDPVRVLTALGATDLDPVDLIAVDCPGQGTARTARSAGRGTSTGPPGAMLPRPVGTVVVTDTPEVYAYRTGAVSVVVESGDGRIRVATTTGCPA